MSVAEQPQGRLARARGRVRSFTPGQFRVVAFVALVASGVAQTQDFSGAKLTAPPTTSWPANGGNLYNQRYSTLKTINRTNVAQLKAVWRARLSGSGTAPQYSGFEGECGVDSETTVTRARPQVTTVVSNEVVVPDSTITDSVRVIGVTAISVCALMSPHAMGFFGIVPWGDAR